MVACAAPSYLAAHGVPRTPADLARHACLLQTGPTRGDVWSFTPEAARAEPGRPCTSAARVQVRRSAMRSNDVEALAAATRAGMGIALLPEFLVRARSPARHLRAVLPRFATRSVDVYAVYSERRHLPARTRALLDFLTARLRARRR